MRDKRSVDELSIEELERILAIRKREERQKRLRRYGEIGRRVVAEPSVSTTTPLNEETPPAPADTSTSGTPAQSEQTGVALPAQAMPSPDNGSPQFEDDPAFIAFAQDKKADNGEPSEFWRMVWNRLLLLMEVFAFIGLILLGAQMLQGLQTIDSTLDTLNEESAAAQALASLPTPTATPEITLHNVVLPGGHTSPTSPGGARFNIEEVPEHLRSVVQSQLAAAPIVIPTPGPQSPIRIQIPRISVDHSVVAGTDWEALKRGVGYLDGSGLPGQAGNMVFSAHNDIYGEIFRYLDQIQPGDEIIVFTTTQRYTYTVRETQIVQPTDVYVMDPTRDPTATLISCYPYQVDNQRFVVFADLQSVS